MAWVDVAYTVSLGLSGLFGFGVAALIWQERPKRGATWLSLVAVAVGLWAVGEAVVLSPLGPETVGVGTYVALLGAVFVPALFLRFALAYVGHAETVPRPARWALLAVPAGLTILGLQGHDLVAPFFAFVSGADESPLLFRDGFVAAVYIYVNGALLASEYLLFEKFLTSRNVFRKRSFLLLGQAVLLHVCHLVTVLGFSPTPSFTLTPLVHLTVGVCSLVMIASRQLSFLPLEVILSPFTRYSRNLAPIARNWAIQAMETGFLVVDHEGRVVDTNPTAKTLLGLGDARVVGKELTAVLPTDRFDDDPPGFVTGDRGTAIEGRYDAIWIETPDGEQRCVDVLVSTLEEAGEVLGHVGLVHDVTDRERREQTLKERTLELERQNERLEDFAQVVSHDLRNPLSVAGGRLQLVDAGDDQEHVEQAIDALGRIETIVDDVLAFARLGTTVEDTTPVALADVAREAWGHVDTEAASLVVDGDVTVPADYSRLLQVFENLFRNAVEHGSTNPRSQAETDGQATADTDVTVTVGATETGFFVADNGPGIPAEHREDVLERGYTTDPDGTGFGLAIVRTIVEAHGWTVTVGESADGGARFDVRGVDLIDREQRQTA